jgi:serine/threonine-protein kinase
MPGKQASWSVRSSAMSEPAAESSPPDFEQVRASYTRARSVPAAEREAFVRARVTDPHVVAEVLALLAADETPTDTAGQAPPEPLASAGPAPSGSAGAAGDRVQSTATGELLAKLATPPKLDEQRFALECELGRGGMGVVLRIHDRYLNRRLALKVMLQPQRSAARDDEERRLANQVLGRFLEEAQITSQLDHPGVVPVHELGLDASGRMDFTMRLVKGRTASKMCADAFAEQNDWTLTRALEVILKVCDAMAYAHDKGVQHRDLKRT